MGVRYYDIYFSLPACFRVTLDEMQEHPEFDIDSNGEVSHEEAMVRVVVCA